MIGKYVSLDNEQQGKVKNLMDECNEFDQSIVPVQFDHSLNYFAKMNSWFLYFEEDELMGVISIFNPLADVAEISGCTKPGRRSAGIFNALLSHSNTELNAHDIKSVLFVVDNDSKPGMSAIEKLQLKCDHVEYLMKYEKFKEEYSSSIRVREAQSRDIDDFIAINSELFHETHEESRNMIMHCLQASDRKAIHGRN